MKRLLRTGEAGEMLGVTPKTIREWIKEGRIKALRIGKEYRVPYEEVERLLREAERNAVQEAL